MNNRIAGHVDGGVLRVAWPTQRNASCPARQKTRIRAMALIVGACLAVSCNNEKPEVAQEERDMSRPEHAIEAFQKAVARRDAKTIWNLMSGSSQDFMTRGPGAAQLALLRDLPDETVADLAAAANTTPAALRAQSQSELAASVLLAEAWRSRDDIIGATVVAVDTPTAGRAVVRIRAPNGKDTSYALVVENGQWKVDGQATGRLRAPRDEKQGRDAP